MSAFSDDLIQRLDDALAEAGSDVILRRVFSTALVPYDVTVRARIDGYTPVELVGEITQQDQRFIISPTQIDAAGWPGYTTGQNPNIDNRIPRKNDVLITARGKLTVQAANGFYIDDALVRIEGRVRGN